VKAPARAPVKAPARAPVKAPARVPVRVPVKALARAPAKVLVRVPARAQDRVPEAAVLEAAVPALAAPQPDPINMFISPAKERFSWAAKVRAGNTPCGTLFA